MREYKTTEKQREYYRNRNRINWRPRLVRFLYWARRRQGDLVTITIENLMDQLLDQNYLCYYSGISLDLTSPKNMAPSIDRLDNTKGYIPGNVVFCLWCINRAKSNMTEEEFLVICKSIAVWQEKKKKDIPLINLKVYNNL
jgi:hypothetical protein